MNVQMPLVVVLNHMRIYTNGNGNILCRPVSIKYVYKHATLINYTKHTINYTKGLILGAVYAKSITLFSQMQFH